MFPFKKLGLIVSDQTREIAVRLAIGASPAEMIRLVGTGAARLLAAGLVLGIAVTAAPTACCAASPPSIPERWPPPLR